MKTQLLIPGKPKLAYAQTGCDFYLKRLKPYGNYELNWLKESAQKHPSEQLLNASEGWVRIAIDERGKSYTTEEFLALTQELQHDPEHRHKKGLCFLIGSANGHMAELRQKSDEIINVAPWVLQHELALLMLLEQLYRIESLKAGSPYHRK